MPLVLLLLVRLVTVAPVDQVSSTVYGDPSVSPVDTENKKRSNHSQGCTGGLTLVESRTTETCCSGG